MPARPDASATRALARLYSPPAQQALLAALCAIESEIAASLGAGLDHQVAHLRLAWWREECARCLEARPAHPLTRALFDCLPGHDPAPLAGLTGLADTAAWDLAAATFETRRELTAYCARWAGAMIAPLARLGAPDAEPALGEGVGAAVRELELLGLLGSEARAGRIRLPLDELGRAGVEPQELAHPPWPAGLAARLRERHAELRATLASAVRALGPAGQPGLRGVLVWAALASAHSRRAVRHLPQAPPGPDYHSALDGLRAWRAARAAGSGRLRLRED